MWHALRALIVGGVALGLAVVAAGRERGPQPDPAAGRAAPTRVIVLGMVHQSHRTSALYSTERVRSVIRQIMPDAVLAEIPPASLADAWSQHRTEGKITRGRAAVFPEYTDALFPIAQEAGFEIVATAAWTPEMNAERSEKLRRWRTERPQEIKESDDAQALATRRIAQLGDPNDPAVIHTDRYDQLVRAGMEPYNRLFNQDIGAGGWDNINRAHMALIHAALDQRSGLGQTVVITFGSWHKYWFLEDLKTRKDIELVDPLPYFQRVPPPPAPTPPALTPPVPLPRPSTAPSLAPAGAYSSPA
ncbi:MAG: hypothetical protein C0475_00475 [Planctomyces sp.]|nr:hypothetical protein [Planctomyces sp.]MBA4119161.1 hypothetical protein [Isosphaera sp.]